MEDAADAIRGPWLPKRVVRWRKWGAVIGWLEELYQRASLISDWGYGVRFQARYRTILSKNKNT